MTLKIFNIEILAAPEISISLTKDETSVHANTEQIQISATVPQDAHVVCHMQKNGHYTGTKYFTYEELVTALEVQSEDKKLFNL